MRMWHLLTAIAMTALGATNLIAQDETDNARLSRPESRDADGKLYAESTVGNLMVDTIGSTRRYFLTSKNPAVAEVLVEQLYCKSLGSGEVYAISVANRLKKKAKDEKALLRARDPAATHLFALEIIGYLDNISAQSIADDEAIGPGVYHDAIAGMEQALQVCNFYGHLR
jgi:hypothetical protein